MPIPLQSGQPMMIPQLPQPPGLNQPTLAYLDALQQQGYTGDIATSYAQRLAMSTDNSIYQLLPDAVLFPRTTADVALICRLAGESSFSSLVFTPRGGGTGTNGQALNQGIVVDMSRHMNQILEINLHQGWVRVEAGVVKDQLNAALRPHGYFFSPELSTSNRATLGGMINTDASGQGSLVYGKTSDHVLALRAVLLGGDIIDTMPVPLAVAEERATEATAEGRIYKTVLERCFLQRALILEKFPRLNRFLTGYDLRHVVSDDLQQIDLSRILCGSEGTLAFITEARLNITPLPEVRCLVNISYDSFDSALRNAPMLLEASALSVETIDSAVLKLAQEDIVWHSVKSWISNVAVKNLMGLNIVEFAGNDSEKINAQVTALCQRLETLIKAKQSGVTGYTVCRDAQGIECVFAMRKKAVGLLGNSPGDAKPIPFVEDTCVPPEHLADYIAEFRALLDGHGLSYGMFGHVDAGVLHVRPALDMCNPTQEKLIRELSDQIVALTMRYGGLLWGEHGKGFRAAYSPDFFGEVLYHELRLIKAAFDPDNRLNPGKICAPADIDAPVKSVDNDIRGSRDRQIPVTVRNDWRGAMTCNGNGLCFNFDLNSLMCPSMKISRDRVHSPKGRATLIREWLRLLAESGTNLAVLEKQLTLQYGTPGALIARWRNSWQARRGAYDFSHEVKEAMAGCLACKACSTQCPVKIDVPEFRTRFLQLYYSRYLRPASDHLIASIEHIAPLLAWMPKIVNRFLRYGWLSGLLRHQFGVVDLPQLSVPTLQQKLASQPEIMMTLEQLEALSPAARQKRVLIVQDPFTSYFEARLIADLVLVIKKLGYMPVVLPYSPNGKAQHIKGFVRRFARTAGRTADFLNRVARLGIPLVGVDAALVLCYRDEYRQVLGDNRGTFHVQLLHEWLSEVLVRREEVRQSSEAWYLFGHCSEVAALPAMLQQWQQIFNHFGARLETVNVGCCGMAGTYGHETQHYHNSVGIFTQSWQPALQKLPRERCLATGYSCRAQVGRLEGSGIRHPLQALLELIP